jgi:hypothetical protein
MLTVLALIKHRCALICASCLHCVEEETNEAALLARLVDLRPRLLRAALGDGVDVCLLLGADRDRLLSALCRFLEGNL